MLDFGHVRVSYVRIEDRPTTRPPSRAGAWIVESAGLRHLVDMEVQKAQRLRYSIALLCIAAGRNGAETEHSAASSLAERVTPLFRSTDAVAIWSPSTLAAMLVDAEIAHLPSIVDRLTTRLELYRWSAGGACYPKTSTHADELYDRAHDLMMQAERAGENLLYLPS